ncbi:MAG: hypothetical protein V1702_06450 [Candidatus Woesearchaeota archaeon]
MLYDVIQVEDDGDVRISVQDHLRLERASSSYLGLPTLQALKDALPTSQAKVYVVDGLFPRDAGEQAGRYYMQAIEAIRAKEPGAKIVFYSTDKRLEGYGRDTTFVPKPDIKRLMKTLEGIIAQRA